MEEDKVTEPTLEPVKEVIVEKRQLSNAEIVELGKRQLEGVKYFGVGVKNDFFRVIINEISAYEFMPVSLIVDEKEYMVNPIEEKCFDLDNNHFKESFFARKNKYLAEKGKEKEEFVLNVKSKKKQSPMVIEKSDDLLKELYKEKNLMNTGDAYK